MLVLCISGARHRLERERIRPYISKCEEEEMGEIHLNGQRAAPAHNLCQTQVSKSRKDKGHQDCVHMGTATGSHGCVDRQQARGSTSTKMRIFSLCILAQEVVQKQGHFIDNFLEYRYIWFGCLGNSCYATQIGIYIFSAIIWKSLNAHSTDKQGKSKAR